MKKSTLIIFWVVRIVAAIIMLQTLYYKFSGAEESIYIFTRVGMEPWGRIGTGVLEFIASALIIYVGTVWLGAVLALGLMGGAIMMHLTLLGVEVKGDGGYLFFLAIIVAISSLTALWLDRKNIPAFIRKYLPAFLN